MWYSKSLSWAGRTGANGYGRVGYVSVGYAPVG